MENMEQKVGIILCTRGTSTCIIGSRLCHMERGMATILSPLLPIVEVEGLPQGVGMMGVVQKEHCEGCDLGPRSVDDGV